MAQTKEQQQRWYETNKIRLLAAKRAVTARIRAKRCCLFCGELHPDTRRKCSKCGLTYKGPPKGDDPVKKRERSRRHKYRLSKTAFKVLLAEAAGACRICYGDGGKRGLVIDHCHTTKRVRGMLCDRCNRLLGMVGDNPSLLREVADYLDRYNC